MFILWMAIPNKCIQTLKGKTNVVALSINKVKTSAEKQSEGAKIINLAFANQKVAVAA